MKFSVRQILASAVGAVLAAVLASLFGVKGTIIGVAIGSAAATFGTALVAQSIEHGQRAVKQVVVRAPEASELLRRLGGTAAAGRARTAGDEPVTTAAQAPETGEVEAPVAAGQVAGVEAEPELERPGVQGGIRWPVIAGTAAVVFVLSLMFVTSIELIAGRPLADLFGGHYKGGGTTVQQIIQSPPTTTLPATSTTTSTASSTTSTASSTSSTSVSSTSDGTSSSTTGAGSSTTSVGGTGTGVAATSTTAPVGG